MELLSDLENKLYDYIKKNKEVTYDAIRKNLGLNYMGAIGKLLNLKLIEKGKRKTNETISTGFDRYGTKLVKILKLKDKKENNV